jgi:hypothetical protein
LIFFLSSSLLVKTSNLAILLVFWYFATRKVIFSCPKNIFEFYIFYIFNRNEKYTFFIKQIWEVQNWVITLNIKNLDEIFLHKHCKERAYVITHFWPHIKNQEKKKENKTQNTRGYTLRKSKRLPNLVVKESLVVKRRGKEVRSRMTTWLSTTRIE